MQLSSFLKNVKRQARIELRLARVATLTERATAAGNDSQVAAFAKEATRRNAELNYRATRNEADLEDNPGWQSAHDTMRDATLRGSRGAKDTKAMLAAALGGESAPEAATAE